MYRQQRLLYIVAPLLLRFVVPPVAALSSLYGLQHRGGMASFDTSKVPQSSSVAPHPVLKLKGERVERAHLENA